MSPAQSVAVADHLTAQAVTSLKSCDRTMSGEKAAYLVSRSALLQLAMFRGDNSVAASLRTMADEFEARAA